MAITIHRPQKWYDYLPAAVEPITDAIKERKKRKREAEIYAKYGGTPEGYQIYLGEKGVEHEGRKVAVTEGQLNLNKLSLKERTRLADAAQAEAERHNKEAERLRGLEIGQQDDNVRSMITYRAGQLEAASDQLKLKSRIFKAEDARARRGLFIAWEDHRERAMIAHDRLALDYRQFGLNERRTALAETAETGRLLLQAFGLSESSRQFNAASAQRDKQFASQLNLDTHRLALEIASMRARMAVNTAKTGKEKLAALAGLLSNHETIRKGLVDMNMDDVTKQNYTEMANAFLSEGINEVGGIAIANFEGTPMHAVVVETVRALSELSRSVDPDAADRGGLFTAGGNVLARGTPREFAPAVAAILAPLNKAGLVDDEYLQKFVEAGAEGYGAALQIPEHAPPRDAMVGPLTDEQATGIPPGSPAELTTEQWLQGVNDIAGYISGKSGAQPTDPEGAAEDLSASEFMRKTLAWQGGAGR